MSKKLKLFLKIAVTIGFLVWAVESINWQEMIETLRKIELWQIVVYIAVVVLGILISSYKWKLLAEFKGINLPLRDFFKYYFTGTFINNFMPSFIGGDTFRAYEIGKEEKKYAEAASTVMIDRFTGLVSATILAIIFTFVNFKTVFHHPTLIIVNILVVLSLLLDLAVTKIKHVSFVKKIGLKFIPEKILKVLREMDSYNHNSHVFGKSVFWGMIFSLIGLALSNYILFLSLGIEIKLLDYLSVIFLIAIISSVPITVNNIGLKEWAYVTFFGFFGISSSSVIMVAILSRFLQMGLSFFALPVYIESKKDVSLLKKKEEKSSLQKEFV